MTEGVLVGKLISERRSAVDLAQRVAMHREKQRKKKGGGGGGGGGDDVISQIVFDGELPADALNVDLSAVLVLSAIDPAVRALPRHGIVWRTISIVASLPRDGALRETIGPQTIDGAGILNRFYRLEFERAPESPPTLNVGVLLGLEARRPGSHLCVLTDETPPGGFLSATQDCREASSTEAIEVGFVTISEAVSCCVDERFLWIGQYRYRSVRAGPILVPMAGDDAQSRAIYAVVTPVDPAENPGSSAGSSGGGAQDSNSAEDASNTTKFIIGVVVTRDTLSQVLLVNAVVWCVMLLCIALIKARHRVMSVLRQSCGCFRCFRAEGLSSSSGSTNARPLLSPEAAAELDMIAMREIMNTPVTSTAAAATGISQGEHRGNGAVPSSCGADPDNDNDGDTVVIGGGRGGGGAINQHAGTGRSGNVNLNSSYNNGNGGNDYDDDDDDDDNDDNECRFCRDPTAEPLIAPCLCNGSLRFVHRSCLDNWRFRGTGNPLACDICRGTYDIPVPFGVRMQTFLSTWFLGLSHTQQLLVATLVLECAIVTAGYILKFYLAAFYCEHGLYSWAFWSFVHHFLGASVGCAFFLAVYVGFSLTGGRSRAAAARARAAAPQPAPGHFVNLDDVETDNENRDRGVANNPGQVDAEAARLAAARREPVPARVLIPAACVSAIPVVLAVGMAVDGLVWLAFGRGSGIGWIPRDVTNFPVCIAFAGAAASIGLVTNSCANGAHRSNRRPRGAAAGRIVVAHGGRAGAAAGGPEPAQQADDGHRLDEAERGAGGFRATTGGLLLEEEESVGQGGRDGAAPAGAPRVSSEDEDSYTHYR
eukprot:TRINITY_DN3406_c1_g2_i4.p1 TRINITY_DN3406_c1_g2~~TRINITY_DN3406_c1_g2_i4.p1  ORF type:complete len:822 (-),score=292.81 TRINITY_DN3406_c1_g2_i4:16-2481(-)